MATYLDGMDGGKHNSDNTEAVSKPKTKKITRENIASHLLDYQLTLIGKTRVDMIDNDTWRIDWKMAIEKHEQFYNYAIPLIQKIFRCNRRKAVDTFLWFKNTFGIKGIE